MEYLISTYPMLSLFVVMLIAGFLGGAINHFLTQENNNVTPLKSFLGRDLLVGLGASFSVPLFLNMISSDLMTVIAHDNKDGKFAPEKIYVFAGFCLIAAISSRAFIRTLSDKILREVKEAKQEAKSADEKMQQMQASMAPILEKETENEEEATLPKNEKLVHGIADDVAKVLRALAYGKHTLRSLSGISSETALEKVLVHQILDELMSKGLVAQRERERGPRWYITAEGRKLIRDIQQENQGGGE